MSSITLFLELFDPIYDINRLQYLLNTVEWLKKKRNRLNETDQKDIQIYYVFPERVCGQSFPSMI